MKRFTVFDTFILILLVVMLAACGSSPAGSATASPVASAAPGATPALPITHVTIPGEGAKQEANAHDNFEGTTFQDKDVKTGDRFNVNQFERPFTSKDMAYLPYVDIKNMALTSDATFYYIQIELIGLGKGNKLPLGTYGAEFDQNMDGRAEFIVLASPPFSKDWTTNGVKFYFDTNGDVGGSRLYPDAAYTGNGYETLLFDSGNGPDPDLAWAHFVQSSKPVVELALKRSVFDESGKFLWNVLASANPVDPTKLYYNDTYSTKQAGSPSKGDDNYPLNQFWGFDNTCRVPLGFTAMGNEPMGCSVLLDPPDASLGEPAPPACYLGGDGKCYPTCPFPPHCTLKNP
jgi:hypothetical protein